MFEVISPEDLTINSRIANQVYIEVIINGFILNFKHYQDFGRQNNRDNYKIIVNNIKTII